MKRTTLKLLCITMAVAVSACLAAYAGKDYKCKKAEDSSCHLPDAAKTALNALYPNAEIQEKSVEKEMLKVYKVELMQNNQKVKVTMAPCGTLVAVETEMAVDALPAPVAQTITKAAEGATIKRVAKQVAHSALKPVKLDQPKTTYEAKLGKDEKKCKLTVATDGTILKQSEWKHWSEWKKYDKDKPYKSECKHKDEAHKAECHKHKEAEAAKPECSKSEKKDN